uniref:Synuclein gamma n=1 Tax=Pipistrellus kuhlii TaxID=59472 RepID=A0A7J7T1F0_PIPKU|nr:synuclein gamma [Pipistrellus kuhlii]
MRQPKRKQLRRPRVGTTSGLRVSCRVQRPLAWSPRRCARPSWSVACGRLLLAPRPVSRAVPLRPLPRPQPPGLPSPQTLRVLLFSGFK